MLVLVPVEQQSIDGWLKQRKPLGDTARCSRSAPALAIRLVCLAQAQPDTGTVRHHCEVGWNRGSTARVSAAPLVIFFVCGVAGHDPEIRKAGDVLASTCIKCTLDDAGETMIAAASSLSLAWRWHMRARRLSALGSIANVHCSCAAQACSTSGLWRRLISGAPKQTQKPVGGPEKSSTHLFSVRNLHRFCRIACDQSIYHRIFFSKIFLLVSGMS